MWFEQFSIDTWEKQISTNIPASHHSQHLGPLARGSIHFFMLFAPNSDPTVQITAGAVTQQSTSEFSNFGEPVWSSLSFLPVSWQRCHPVWPSAAVLPLLHGLKSWRWSSAHLGSNECLFWVLLPISHLKPAYTLSHV